MKQVLVTIKVEAILEMPDEADVEVCAENYAGVVVGLERHYKKAYKVRSRTAYVYNVQSHKLDEHIEKGS
jgi:hypothetical protein